MILLNNLVANFAGPPKRKVVNGREYLIVPLTMIVPGVLSGSKGPLLYPKEEIARDPGAWDGVPLTIDHPYDPATGSPLSINGPGVRERQVVGVVQRSRIAKDGKLVADGWFDVERTRSIAPRILNDISAGRPVEISTGLFTTNEPAPLGSRYNDRPYDFIARDYGPDHLAVLSDEVGACSIRDGCGANVANNRPKRKRKPSCSCSHNRGTTVNDYQLPTSALSAVQRNVLEAGLRAICNTQRDEDIVANMGDDELVATFNEIGALDPDDDFDDEFDDEDSEIDDGVTENYDADPLLLPGELLVANDEQHGSAKYISADGTRGSTKDKFFGAISHDRIHGAAASAFHDERTNRSDDKFLPLLPDSVASSANGGPLTRKWQHGDRVKVDGLAGDSRQPQFVTRYGVVTDVNYDGFCWVSFNGHKPIRIEAKYLVSPDEQGGSLQRDGDRAENNYTDTYARNAFHGEDPLPYPGGESYRGTW